jgi:hypothetical protein
VKAVHPAAGRILVGGARKICTVPSKMRRKLQPIHLQKPQKATSDARKTIASEAWTTKPPVKPCASRAPSPAPEKYEAMKYTCRGTATTTIVAKTR